MTVLNYSNSFKALDQYIKTYNESKEKLSEQVRQSTTATTKDIIRIYGLFLAKADSIETINPKQLPPLRTNNIQLAKAGHTSPERSNATSTDF